MFLESIWWEVCTPYVAVKCTLVIFLVLQVMSDVPALCAVPLWYPTSSDRPRAGGADDGQVRVLHPGSPRCQHLAWLTAHCPLWTGRGAVNCPSLLLIVEATSLAHCSLLMWTRRGAVYCPSLLLIVKAKEWINTLQSLCNFFVAKKCILRYRLIYCASDTC